MDAAIHFAAHKVGLGALKPKQVEVIKAFASGSYPYPRGTGSPFATFCSRLCLISSLGEVVRLCCISPLTSLMMEQRSKFSKLGLCCEYVGQLQQDMESMANVQSYVQLLFAAGRVRCKAFWRAHVVL